MIAGSGLDVLVAEKVMGLEVISDPKRYLEVSADGGDIFGKKYVCTVMCHNQTFEARGSRIATIPQYSTDIGAAWLVVEHMQKSAVCGYISLYSPTDESKYWFAKFSKKWHSCEIYDGELGDAAPHAICIAALDAVGIPV